MFGLGQLFLPGRVNMIFAWIESRGLFSIAHFQEPPLQTVCAEVIAY
jgi:hypothetical protein